MTTIPKKLLQKAPMFIVIGLGFAQQSARPAQRSHRVPPSSQAVNLRLRCDLPCVLSIDGQKPRLLSAKKELRLHVAKGSHELKALTFDGKDSWRASVGVGVRATQPVVIPLASARTARETREREIDSLRHQLVTKQDDESHLQVQVAKLREASEERLRQQQKTDQVRRAIVSHIVELERAMNHESQEVTRLQSDMNSAEVSSGTSGSLGGIIDALNKTHSASIQNSINRHNDRLNRLLHRVDVLTSELGAVRNGQEPKTSVPPSSFEVFQKTGKSWDKSDFELTSGGFRLQTETHSCGELKHVSRDGDDRVVWEINKKKTTIRLMNAQDREAVLERWYTNCPAVVNW